MMGLGLGIGIGGAASSAPTLPVAGAALWLRSDLGITIIGSGVGQWNDQTTNARNAVQATDASRPTYSASGGIRGLPKLSGVANKFLTGSSSPFAAGGDRTVFAIVQAASNGGGIFLTRDTVFSSFYYFTSSGPNLRAYSDDVAINDVVSGASADTTAVHLLIWTWTGGTATFSIDGVAQTLSGGATSADSGSSVYKVMGAGNNFIGDLYEVACWPSVLSAPNQGLIHTYAQGRYGTA